MRKIKEEKTKTFYHFYPGIVTVIVVDTGVERNAMSAVWNMGISFTPPLFGVAIAPKRYTHHLVEQAGEFTANFLPYEKAEIIAACGRTSGKETDKFKKFNIPLENAVKIRSPILKDAYAAYECKVVNKYTLGDHTLFVGEVVMVHYDPDAFQNDGLPNLAKLNPALYLGQNIYLDGSPYKTKHIDREELEIWLQGKR